MDIYR
ncbi:hypothetical protein ACS0PU_004201 [Formica fusca]